MTMHADGAKAEPTALTRLREMTRVHHQSLEDALQLGHGPMERPTYTKLVQRFHALYRAIETDSPQAPGLLRWHSDLDRVGYVWAERCKLPWLEQDLRALDAPALPTEGAPQVSCMWPSLAAVLGSLYVLEGSTLGGQLISRHLRDTLRLTPSTGMAFFSGYGKQTGRMWRQMRHILAAQLVSEAQMTEATLAAQQMFVLFRRWLAP